MTLPVLSDDHSLQQFPVIQGSLGEITERIRALDSERMLLLEHVYRTQMWRSEYLSFEDWLEQGCGYSPRASRPLLSAIQLRVTGYPIPSVAVAKVVATLPPEQVGQVLIEAARNDPDGRITAAGVSDAAKRIAIRNVSSEPDTPDLDTEDAIAELRASAPGLQEVEHLESAIRVAISAAKRCNGLHAASRLDINVIINTLSRLAAGVSSETPAAVCRLPPPHSKSCDCRGRGWLTRSDLARIDLHGRDE